MTYKNFKYFFLDVSDCQNKTEHIFGLIPILVILIMRPGAIKFRKALVNLFILFLLHTIFLGASLQIFSQGRYFPELPEVT